MPVLRCLNVFAGGEIGFRGSILKFHRLEMAERTTGHIWTLDYTTDVPVVRSGLWAVHRKNLESRGLNDTHAALIAHTRTNIDWSEVVPLLRVEYESSRDEIRTVGCMLEISRLEIVEEHSCCVRSSLIEKS